VRVEEGFRHPGRGDFVHGRRGALGAPGRAHPREALHDRWHPLRHLRLHDVSLPAHHHGTFQSGTPFAVPVRRSGAFIRRACLILLPLIAWIIFAA